MAGPPKSAPPPGRGARGAVISRAFESNSADRSSRAKPSAQASHRPPPRLVWVNWRLLELEAAHAEVAAAGAARRHRHGRESERCMLLALARLLDARLVVMREVRP
jgi:hypothetical protein